MGQKIPSFLDSAVKYGALAASISVVGIFFILFLTLFSNSIPSITLNGIDLLLGRVWNPNGGAFGGLPAILGTLFSSLFSLGLALPLSMSISIYYTEYAPNRIRSIISTVMDLLAAIPSVIYGIWGLWTISPLLKTNFEEPIAATIGFIPIFSGPAYGLSIFLASLVLTIMITPIISSLSIEIFSRTPMHLREGMFALGATRWEVCRKVVIPFAKRGVIAAAILGLGRALGETMAVTMVIGNSYIWPFSSVSIFSPAHTITSKVASEFPESVSNAIQFSSLTELALVLLIISLSINLGADLLLKRVKGGG
jgi:phosphate transport system permease protein